MLLYTAMIITVRSSSRAHIGLLLLIASVIALTNELANITFSIIGLTNELPNIILSIICDIIGLLLLLLVFSDICRTSCGGQGLGCLEVECR